MRLSALLGFLPHWTLPQWTLSVFAYLHAWVYRFAVLLSLCWQTHTYIHTYTPLSLSIGVYQSDVGHIDLGVELSGYPSQFRLHCEMRHCAPRVEGEQRPSVFIIGKGFCLPVQNGSLLSQWTHWMRDGMSTQPLWLTGVTKYCCSLTSWNQNKSTIAIV